MFPTPGISSLTPGGALISTSTQSSTQVRTSSCRAISNSVFLVIPDIINRLLESCIFCFLIRCRQWILSINRVITPFMASTIIISDRIPNSRTGEVREAGPDWPVLVDVDDQTQLTQVVWSGLDWS